MVIKMDVSNWLNSMSLIVSIADGQTSVCVAAPDVRIVSKASRVWIHETT
jgi:hypothetical protein